LRQAWRSGSWRRSSCCRRFATFLAGIHPYDPLAVGGAVLVLLVVGLAAGYVPARRLGRLNPMQALRRT
jgi:ABC-type antimicrobial peptide transport system permease subunit